MLVEVDRLRDVGLAVPLVTGRTDRVVRNRGALMVLRAGVSKATGLLAALAAVEISAHNVIAVGDANKGLALLHATEVEIAVATAVPSLRHADLVLEPADGRRSRGCLAGPIVRGDELIDSGSVGLVQIPSRSGTDDAVGLFQDATSVFHDGE